MSAEIIVMLISGAVTIITVLISNTKTQAIMQTKLDNLTHEVHEYTSGQRDIEKRIPQIQEQIHGIDKRVTRLEEKIQ